AEAPAGRGPPAARERPTGGGARQHGQARTGGGPRRPRALPPRGRRDRGAPRRRARGAPPLRVGRPLLPERGRGARAADRHRALAAQPRPRAPARTARAEGEKQGEITMRPMDLAKKLRREAAFDPAALERGKVALMAAMRQDIEPRREPTIVPELPYQDIGAALTFLERAFGFREVPAWRLVTADGVLHRAIVA